MLENVFTSTSCPVLHGNRSTRIYHTLNRARHARAFIQTLNSDSRAWAFRIRRCDWRFTNLYQHSDVQKYMVNTPILTDTSWTRNCNANAINYLDKAYPDNSVFSCRFNDTNAITSVSSAADGLALELWSGTRFINALIFNPHACEQ